jgi:hypothetical protein
MFLKWWAQPNKTDLRAYVPQTPGRAVATCCPNLVQNRAMNRTKVAAARTDHNTFRSPTDAFRKLDQGWVRAAPVRCDILLSVLRQTLLDLGHSFSVQHHFDASLGEYTSWKRGGGGVQVNDHAIMAPPGSSMHATSER